MRLLDLEPEFIKHTGQDGSFREVDSIEQATGVSYLCPKCFVANGGRIGTHHIICWSPAVPADIKPGPGRWNLVGTGLHDLSLVAGSSSVLLTDGCKWHGFVERGEARDA